MTNNRSRPYSNLTVTELEALIAAHPREPSVLAEVTNELHYRRTTKRTKELVERVAQLRSELGVPRTSRRRDPTLPNLDMPPRRRAVPVCPSPVSPEPKHGAGSKPEASGRSQAGMTPRRGERVARIRSREAATGTPTPYVQEPSRELVATWQAEEAPPVRYEKALRLLAKDMRSKKTGAQTLLLKDGRRVSMEAGSFAYRFPWEGDEVLFENARVEILLAKRVVAGRIVAIADGKLTIEVDDDLGPAVPACMLRIDNTAMILALADRMAALAGTGQPRGEEGQAVKAAPAGSFNHQLACAAVSSVKVEMAPPIALPEELKGNGLNGLQVKAVEAALSQRVSFIWGPPGTGKTKALSAIIRALFAAEQRTLICSNTNQAVDQVLKALCEALAGKNVPAPALHVPALRDGWIVRFGTITEDGPLHPWREAISLDSIKVRKTVELQKRLARLEAQAAEIERRLLPARQTLAAYQELDQAIAAETMATTTLRQAATDASARQRALDEATQRLGALEAELRAFDSAGTFRRLVLRHRERIVADLDSVRAALPAVRDSLDRAASDVVTAGQMQSAATHRREIAEAATGGRDRNAARKAVEMGENALGPLRAEIGQIRHQIEDVGKAVLADARVVGVTATKLFLSPDAFGAFAAVIVDEASMLLPPALYNAVGLAKDRAVISGDFRQLSPIVQTEEECIRHELGRDVFRLAGLEEAFDGKRQALPRTTMLNEQYRMADPICQLISQRMYGGRLITGDRPPGEAQRAPAPFYGPLTLIDTSTLGPVVNKDSRGSWFNLMSALVLRNACRHLAEAGYLVGKDRAGVVMPYAAQRRLAQSMLVEDAKLDVTVGTVHRYQGDERSLIFLDLVDATGRPGAGRWFQATAAAEEGAKLLNVAISRAKDHLVILGDLAWLDRKLPADSCLREVLARMQDLGSVVDARQVLGMWPVADDLRQYGAALDLGAEAAATGLFDERDFLAVARLDIAAASKGVAIWSAFVTGDGVARLADTLRGRIAAGVSVRCVLPPPERNGSMGAEAWHEAVDVLRAMGATIDIRAYMHEKVVLVDDQTTWLGSLNLLSHAGHTREVMMRVAGEHTALGVAAFFAADPGMTAERAAGIAYRKENPDCEKCGGLTQFVTTKQGGRFWSCRPCGWTLDTRSGRTRATGDAGKQVGPACPRCGKVTRQRTGPRGAFWGCTGFPACTATLPLTPENDEA